MLILFFKAHVKAHTRRLKNGKVISIAAYSDKRRHQQDALSGELFANVPSRPHAIRLTPRAAPHIHPVRRAIVLFQADFFNKKPLDSEQIVQQSIQRTPTPETANMTNPIETAQTQIEIPPQEHGGLRVSALEQNGEPYNSHGIMYVPLKATVTIGTQTKQVTGVASARTIVIYDLIGRYPTGKPRKASVSIDRATGRQDVNGGIGTGSSRSNNTMSIVGFDLIAA